MRPPLGDDHATLADALEAAGERYGDRSAFVDGASGARMSFAQWHRRADVLAAELVARGVAPGDVVVIMVPSSLDYAVAYGAIVLAGAVATGINTRLGRREIDAILAKAAPTAAIHDPAAFPDADLRTMAVVARSELAELDNERALGSRRPDRSSTDPAAIIWTSGTTGLPKGAWFDHRNLRATVAAAGVVSHPFDIKLVGTPFAHAGYMAKIWDQLAWGTTVVISPAPWSAGEMLRLLVEERITVGGGVPTQWAKLLEEPGLVESDLSHLRIGLVATAPAAPELIEQVSATIGCPLVVRYAMTESPSITGTDPDDPPDVQARTVGRPQVGMSVELVDEHGVAVPAGSVGRVRVRGACVMRGYWADPELTADVLDADGGLLSSDLGRLDEDGNLVLAGRVTDMYIRGGYNVYPVEVEHVLAEHPAVHRAAVVGAPAPVIGEIGVAFVVPVDRGDPAPLAELRAWVSARLADYKAPDRMVVVDELPLTAMGKIDKLELGRRAALTGDDRDGKSKSSERGVRE